jgi:predicted aspartyl protease
LGKPVKSFPVPLAETLIEKVGAEVYQFLIDTGFKPEEEDDAVYQLLSQVRTSPPD